MTNFDQKNKRKSNLIHPLEECCGDDAFVSQELEDAHISDASTDSAEDGKDKSRLTVTYFHVEIF